LAIAGDAHRGGAPGKGGKLPSTRFGEMGDHLTDFKISDIASPHESPAHAD
jgi:hypothetical protein